MTSYSNQKCLTTIHTIVYILMIYIIKRINVCKKKEFITRFKVKESQLILQIRVIF